MVRTRGQRAADTSDDEAPDEVVNVKAQEEGAKQRRAAREAAASAKKRKPAPAQHQQQSAPKQAAQAQAGPSSAHEGGEADGGGGQDMLPEVLLRQLAERRRCGPRCTACMMEVAWASMRRPACLMAPAMTGPPPPFANNWYLMPLSLQVGGGCRIPCPGTRAAAPAATRGRQAGQTPSPPHRGPEGPCDGQSAQSSNRADICIR